MRHSVKKGNKGFSLVELIIVVAIMVALVAVMGPQYIKYVQSSRDAIVTNAAQDVLSMVKTELGLGRFAYTTGNNSGYILIGAENKNGPIRVTLYGLSYDDGQGSSDFEATCGVDLTKIVKSQREYKISISGDDISAHPELVEVEMDLNEPDNG